MIQTSSGTTEHLRLAVTAPSIQLANTLVTVRETAAASLQFEQPALDVTMNLGSLNPAAVDQIRVTLTAERSHQLDMVETGNNTMVFVNAASGMSMTLRETGTAHPQATFTGADLPSEVTYVLAPKSSGSSIYANFTQQPPTSLPSIRPKATTACLHPHGQDSGDGNLPPINLKVNDGTDVSVQMNADPTDASTMISEPLLLASGGGNYGGLKVLEAAEGEATELETKVFDQVISKAKGILPAFLGAALDGIDFKAASQTSGDHWDILDRIIGRNTSNWRFWSTPSKLGYPNSTVDKEVTDADLHAAMPKHSIFYIMAHGVAVNALDSNEVNFKGFVVWKDGERKHVVSAQDDIANHIGDNEYNLVFLNACGGANDTFQFAKSYASAFKARNYVSWDFPVIIPAARSAAEEFFNKLDGGTTVAEARIDVRAQRAIIPGLMGGMGLGQTELTSVVLDDDVIIDLTPGPTTP
ncbi:MAG: hypothetical protein HC904_17580 [Blastochloris sp.]|nr:hypothetical protein [Blastochloris sp.]